MNTLKKIFGVLWILAGLFAGYYLLSEMSFPKFKAGGSSNLIPAIIYTFILLPIIVGSLLTFGYYCFSGDYNDDQY